VLFNPVLGRLVDRLGERKVLVFDSFVLMLVCFGYGGAKHLGLPDFWALMLVFACFIVDQLFFAVGMARDTYMAKIAESPRDLTASLSLGISINHLIAMTVPSFGSMLWKAYGYESVFMAAGVVAIMMTFFASRIRVPHQQETHQSELRAGG
jgi:predicted MFS family arabinose efflux permease